MGTDHKGFDNLQSAQDLLAMLEHDLDRMKASPTNTYAAFDFFVTSEHLIDWKYPNNSDSSKRSHLRKNERILEIVSHLANGNKHFQATQKRHKSVEKVEESHSGFDAGSFSTSSFDTGSFQFVGLTIKLDDGKFIHALELAEKVYQFWKEEI
jgi:hypothetical protein